MRRYRDLGPGAAADYMRRRMTNQVVRVVNRVAPARRTCPCCGWQGARFLDFAGHGYGLSRYVCPGCGSHPRHRGLYLFLEDQVAALKPRATILHLAPEPALASLFAQRHDLDYVTADLAMKSAAVRASLYAMPFRESAFSMIVCLHVLEHLKNDRAALQEIARMVSPGGLALVMVPTFPDWESRPTLEFGAPNPAIDNHWRVYGSDAPTRIEAAGLRCEPLRFSQVLDRERRESYGIDEDTIFLARKP